MISLRRQRRLRHLSTAVDGVGTIEFALVVPIILTLAIGMIDFGIGLWNQMEVGNAARAGAEYVTLHGWNRTAIQNAITGATTLGGVTATPGTPAQICGCPSASSGITTATCGSTCTNGNLANHYVTVGAQASYTMIFPWPGVSDPLTLSATAIGRLYP